MEVTLRLQQGLRVRRIQRDKNMPEPLQTTQTTQDTTPIENQTDQTTGVIAPRPTIPLMTSDSTQKQVTPNQPQSPADAAAKKLETANTQLSKVPDQDVLPPKVHYGAKVIRGITDVLVPKQFKTVINPDGTSSQVPLPRSRKDIGMAIALSALTGAFSGLGERGPGANGRAAAQGFNAVNQQRQQADQQQNAQAQGDFLRKQATLKSNMELRAGAIQAGLYDRDVNNQWSDSYKSAVDAIYENPASIASIVAGSREAPVSEDEADDIIKHSPFQIDRIPVGEAVPRIGPDGQQAWIDPTTRKIVPDNTPGAHPAWDHRFILMKHDSQVPLSDSSGAKDWLKEVVNSPFAPWIQGASKSLLAGNGASGSIPTSTMTSMISQKNRFDLLQHSLNEFATTLNGDKKEGDKGYTKPIDLADALKRGIIDPQTVQMFQNAAGNTAAPNSTQLNTQIDAVTKQNQKAGAKLQALFGGAQLDDYKTKYLADRKKTEQEDKPMTKADADDVLADHDAGKKVNPTDSLRRKQLSRENTIKRSVMLKKSSVGRLKVDAEYQQEKIVIFPYPQNWRTENARQIAGMDNAIDAAKALKQAGVQVPANFQRTLGRVHITKIELKTFPPSVSKGTGQMDAQTAEAYISNFVNPDYIQSDYGAAETFNKDLSKNISGTAGGSLLSAGRAIEHLDSWQPVFKALNNGNVPMANNLINSIGKGLGKGAPVSADLFAHMIAAEVEKVVTTGSPLESRMHDLQADLNRDNSPEQFLATTKSLLDLMHGSLVEINDKNQQYFHRPVKGISQHTTDFFKKSGFETPWERKGPTANPYQEKQQKLQSINLPAQFGGGHPVDIKVNPQTNQTIVSDGKQWIDLATGQPYVPKQ